MLVVAQFLPVAHVSDRLSDKAAYLSTVMRLECWYGVSTAKLRHATVELEGVTAKIVGKYSLSRAPHNVLDIVNPVSFIVDVGGKDRGDAFWIVHARPSVLTDEHDVSSTKHIIIGGMRCFCLHS
jgi:hypothetical protein